MSLVSLNLNYNLIQNIRIAHAFCEQGCELVVDDCDLIKFQNLHSFFQIKIHGKSTIKPRVAQSVNSVSIDHSKPSVTTFGDTRPLVYPKEFISFLKARWPQERPVKFSFTGLMTQQRRTTIYKWAKSNGIFFGLLDKIKVTVLGKLSYQKRAKYLKRYRMTKGGLTVVDSILGREFPFKSLDLDYYETLSRSQFVLCPNGDFIWTYRFFEAIMCGAIPLIEEKCDSYDGFRYSLMTEDANSLVWSEEDAQFNYDKCMELLTYPAGFVQSQLSKCN